MPEHDEPLLTLDEAYRATFHFINQYYQREPITPFLLMLVSMKHWTPVGGPKTNPGSSDMARLDRVCSSRAAVGSTAGYQGATQVLSRG